MASIPLPTGVVPAEGLTDFAYGLIEAININFAQLTGTTSFGGTFVANGATPVTVANANLLITDNVIISLNTVGGTVGAIPHLATITGGTGFTVVGTASDTSTYNYKIIRNTV